MDSGGNASGARPVKSVYLPGDAQPVIQQAPGHWVPLLEFGAVPAIKPNAHPSRSAPKCADCRHISDADMFSSQHYCLHPLQPVSLVDGSPKADCQSARNDAKAKEHGLSCGAAGALFDPVDSGA